jgi:hypothetical protein
VATLVHPDVKPLIPSFQTTTSRDLQCSAHGICSMSRDPRREDCAICTAAALDALFRVRTYGDTSTPYDSELIRKSTRCERQTRGERLAESLKAETWPQVR